MISSDIMRGYNDIMILFLLLEHDSYGYEISKEIQTRTGGLYSMKETIPPSTAWKKADISPAITVLNPSASPAPISPSPMLEDRITARSAANGS